MLLGIISQWRVKKYIEIFQEWCYGITRNNVKDNLASYTVNTKWFSFQKKTDGHKFLHTFQDLANVNDVWRTDC